MAALALRTELVDVQRQLMDDDSDESTQTLHASIREYIAQQLTDEATLIDPAFTGKGPRR